MPQGISFEQAAAVPTSGLIALLNLQNQRKIQPGQSVVINGAAGGVGSIAVPGLTLHMDALKRAAQQGVRRQEEHVSDSLVALKAELEGFGKATDSATTVRSAPLRSDVGHKSEQ